MGVSAREPGEACARSAGQEDGVEGRRQARGSEEKETHALAGGFRWEDRIIKRRDLEVVVRSLGWSVVARYMTNIYTSEGFEERHGLPHKWNLLQIA